MVAYNWSGFILCAHERVKTVCHSCSPRSWVEMEQHNSPQKNVGHIFKFFKIHFFNLKKMFPLSYIIIFLKIWYFLEKLMFFENLRFFKFDIFFENYVKRFGDDQNTKVRHLLQLDVEEKKLYFFLVLILFIISRDYIA